MCSRGNGDQHHEIRTLAGWSAGGSWLTRPGRQDTDRASPAGHRADPGPPNASVSLGDNLECPAHARGCELGVLATDATATTTQLSGSDETPPTGSDPFGIVPPAAEAARYRRPCRPPTLGQIFGPGPGPARRGGITRQPHESGPPLLPVIQNTVRDPPFGAVRIASARVSCVAHIRSYGAACSQRRAWGRGRGQRRNTAIIVGNWHTSAASC